MVKRGPRFDSWVRKVPWRRKWQSTPALLPGKSHGRRSLIGYSPWGCKDLGMTERLHLHFLSKGPVHALRHSVPPALQQATADLLLSQSLLDTLRQVWISLCGVTAPLSWVLVCTKFCLCPPRVCFPVLGKFWWLYGGLMATSSKRAYATPRSAASRGAAPTAVHC